MRRPDTADEILAWLTAYACRVHFQDLSGQVIREKNRVVVEYRVPSGAVAAVGGRDLRTAVVKAALTNAPEIPNAMPNLEWHK